MAGNLVEGRVPAFYGGSYNVAENRYYLLLEDVPTLVGYFRPVSLIYEADRGTLMPARVSQP